jgi:hypothetical protein
MTCDSKINLYDIIHVISVSFIILHHICLIQQFKLFPQEEIVKMLLCERFTLINLVQWLNIRTDNDYPCLIVLGQDNICRHTNKFITI